MRRSEKLFNTLVLSGIALATTTTLEACSCDGPREGPDAAIRADTGSREGPDVGPPVDAALREGVDAAPPLDAAIREGVDVGPPVDAALREGPAMLEDTGPPADDDAGTP